LHGNNILRNAKNMEFNWSCSVSSEETQIMIIAWFTLRQKCITYNTNSDCVATFLVYGADYLTGKQEVFYVMMLSVARC
jgi:hypothetical protein